MWHADPQSVMKTAGPVKLQIQTDAPRTPRPPAQVACHLPVDLACVHGICCTCSTRWLMWV